MKCLGYVYGASATGALFMVGIALNNVPCSSVVLVAGSLLIDRLKRDYQRAMNKKMREMRQDRLNFVRSMRIAKAERIALLKH